jgi:hypothetical protein
MWGRTYVYKIVVRPITRKNYIKEDLREISNYTKIHLKRKEFRSV